MADREGMELSPSKIDLLARVLDASALRHRVVANNIANVNTPGFQRLDVNFEDELAKAIEGGQKPALVHPQVVEDPTAVPRQDGNTVDIDKEMGALSKNSLLYQATSQILASRMAALRLAISGR
jgi:flagellar basal-body rod protein FlgB